MSLTYPIPDQFRQMEWADALVWKAVLSSEPALADDTLRAKLHHVHLVQRGFLAIWQGVFAQGSQEQLMEWAKQGNELRGAELMAWGQKYHQDVGRYLAGLSENTLAQPIVLPWSDMVAATLGNAPVIPTLLETMIQVIMHSTHHRGQINARLRELGHEPPLVDFIAWVWSGRSEAEWPQGSH